MKWLRTLSKGFLILYALFRIQAMVGIDIPAGALGCPLDRATCTEVGEALEKGAPGPAHIAPSSLRYCRWSCERLHRRYGSAAVARFLKSDTFLGDLPNLRPRIFLGYWGIVITPLYLISILASLMGARWAPLVLTLVSTSAVTTMIPMGIEFYARSPDPTLAWIFFSLDTVSSLLVFAIGISALRKSLIRGQTL